MARLPYKSPCIACYYGNGAILKRARSFHSWNWCLSRATMRIFFLRDGRGNLMNTHEEHTTRLAAECLNVSSRRFDLVLGEHVYISVTSSRPTTLNSFLRNRSRS